MINGGAGPWQQPFIPLNPYMKSKQLLICPSDAGNGATKGSLYRDGTLVYASQYGAAGDLFGTSYQFNNELRDVLEVALTEAVRTMMAHNGLTPFFTAVTSTNRTYIVALHLDTINTLFADGHVKSIKMGTWPTS